MVEALAERRLSMINQAGPAPLPGEFLSLGPGDQVEIYRRTTKDRPAWVGPATVRHSDVGHNKDTVTWQNRSIEVPLDSITRAMIFATFQPDAPTHAHRDQEHPVVQLVRDALESIHTRSVFLGWVRNHDVWITTKETRRHWDVLIALLFIAQNLVGIPSVLTIRLASGVKTVQEAPHGTVSILTLYWSTSRPSKVYAHRSSGPRSLSVSRDLGWTNHVDLTIAKFHQYTTTQVQEAEIFDDHDVLRQGGGDGGAPPGEDDIYGPGPRIESV